MVPTPAIGSSSTSPGFGAASRSIAHAVEQRSRTLTLHSGSSGRGSGGSRFLCSSAPVESVSPTTSCDCSSSTHTSTSKPVRSTRHLKVSWTPPPVAAATSSEPYACWPSRTHEQRNDGRKTSGRPATIRQVRSAAPQRVDATTARSTCATPVSSRAMLVAMTSGANSACTIGSRRNASICARTASSSLGAGSENRSLATPAPPGKMDVTPVFSALLLHWSSGGGGGTGVTASAGRPSRRSISRAASSSSPAATSAKYSIGSTLRRDSAAIS